MIMAEFGDAMRKGCNRRLSTERLQEGWMGVAGDDDDEVDCSRSNRRNCRRCFSMAVADADVRVWGVTFAGAAAWCCTVCLRPDTSGVAGALRCAR